MAQIQFLDGPLSGKRARLTGQRITIGRDEKSTIRVDEATIAPRHLILVLDGDDYFLKIDTTRPPVAVNGKQVIEVKLKDGDRLQIGTLHANYFSDAERTPAPNPLDFWAETPAPSPSTTQAPPEQEIISLDDVEDLPPVGATPSPARKRSRRKILAAMLALLIVLGGGVFLLRNGPWKVRSQANQETAKQEEGGKDTGKPPGESPTTAEAPANGGLPVTGAGPSGLVAGGKIHRTKNFKSHQLAVDAAEPGDSVIFDSVDAKPIVIRQPLRDIQFISGSASWQLHADVVDCQFVLHELKQAIQHEGKMERCVFFRCPMKRTRLIHADAVSFYFDERSPLSPKDNPDSGRTPILQLIGFVRDVLIHKPFSGSAGSDKQFAMHWGPSIRILATDPEGDGRGSYILSPVVLGQRAWTPHQIARGNAVTYAHLSADQGVWADPVLEILRGNDCVVLGTALGGEAPTAPEQYAALPRKIKYRDHDELGHDQPGPTFRGAAMTIQGQRTRIVAHGDARKPWTVGRRVALPGLHYADGIVAVDPFIKQFATERGGLSLNLAEQRGVFIMRPGEDGAEFHSNRVQADGSAMFPLDGPNLHRPTFVPLKDLRINAGEFDKMQLADMTGKPMAQIEKELAADRAIFLGAGTYEFKQPLKAGFIAGAGMEMTILKWPEGVDCSWRGCRGLVNCTVSGGNFGHNSQLGAGARAGNSNALFLRTRFASQKEAGINLHATSFQTWQDCEFIGCGSGIGVGLEKIVELKKGDKGAASTTVDNLNICNCTFRQIRQRAIDLTPDSPSLGHVGIHNCLFDQVGDCAIRIDGGQTHLVQRCRLSRCATEGAGPAIDIVSHGVVAFSHLDVDCSEAKGEAPCLSLKGLAAISHCSILCPGTALKCEGLLAADHIAALDGNVETSPGSLLWQCRFKNMDLRDGVALTGENDFADVSAVGFATVVDKGPPAEVTAVKTRMIDQQRRVEWQPAADSESVIVQYIVCNGDREIGHTPFAYEQPTDLHSAFVKAPVPLAFVDPKTDGKNYRVIAVNAAGLTSEGKEAPLRRLGPARARFLHKDDGEIVIKDFVSPKGKKAMEVLSESGKKYPLAKVGLNGAPNEVYFESDEIVEPH